MNTCVICWEEVDKSILTDFEDFHFYMQTGICPECKKNSITPINSKNGLTNNK